ncbi:MlaC/ttg2D family ABC transporter substrate-binding protein [Alcanivorax quisquiliarum]|uniref:ABC transporter substrate-binding protein n=1 Tax=Alcanivorax quisquiliarum TaxID=2933565 RepID=A0ABT0E804_9GAMM|nr:ABC transporter substrate-binding protein [Alcanivorax quisquiliarum]MCK0537900.1 ABC transporter substrate-binding protein [Alcanivorax quisquiliarum]
MKSFWQSVFFLPLLVLGMAAAAQAKQPDEVIRDAVTTLTQRIEAERERMTRDPAYTRMVVTEELEELVDFRRITRLVMGEHFEAATREQRNAFLERFRNSLVQTYAAGVTMYSGEQINVLPLAEGDLRGNRARVQMEFITGSGRVVPIAYTMFQSDDRWRVDNVIVNGLNLGRLFRAQFDQAMAQHNGSIDRVIASWSAEVEVEGKTPAEAVQEAADGA